MSTLTSTIEPTEKVLELVLAMRVPVPDLLRVTRRRIEETQTEDAKLLAEFLASRAASKEGLLVKAAGESISAETVGRILNIGKAAVHKAKDEGRLLAFQEPGKRFFRFPVFQFQGAAVPPWVPELIDLVGNGFAALHFLTVERRSLKGESFLTRFQKADSPDVREACIADLLSFARARVP